MSRKTIKQFFLRWIEANENEPRKKREKLIQIITETRNERIFFFFYSCWFSIFFSTWIELHTHTLEILGKGKLFVQQEKRNIHQNKRTSHSSSSSSFFLFCFDRQPMFSHIYEFYKNIRKSWEREREKEKITQPIFILINNSWASLVLWKQNYFPKKNVHFIFPTFIINNEWTTSLKNKKKIHQNHHERIEIEL